MRRLRLRPKTAIIALLFVLANLFVSSYGPEAIADVLGHQALSEHANGEGVFSAESDAGNGGQQTCGHGCHLFSHLCGIHLCLQSIIASDLSDGFRPASSPAVLTLSAETPYHPPYHPPRATS